MAAMDDKVGKVVASWSWLKTIVGIGGHFEALNRRVSDTLQSQSLLIRALIEFAQTLQDPKHKESFAKKFSDIYGTLVKDSLEREARAGNPLNPVELQRLQGYYAQFQAGTPFDQIHAKDFADLAKRLDQDRVAKNEVDIGAIVLAGIAVIVLAVAVAALAKESK